MDPHDDDHDRYVCTICGKSYTRKFDLKRHQRMYHVEGEEESTGSEREEERDESQEESESQDSSHELEDNEVYRGWYDEAVKANEEARNQKYLKYIREGDSEDNAREKAYGKTLWAIKRDFFNDLETFLIQTVHLRDDDVFQEIVTDVDEKIEGGTELTKAIRRTLSKHKHQFESLFEFEYSEESDDSMEN